MVSLEGKTVLVVGLGASGLAASALLFNRRAKVLAIDEHDSVQLRHEAELLRERGAEVFLGRTTIPDQHIDLAVTSPGVPPSSPILGEVERRRVSLIGEFELGYQHSLCLNVAITGT